MSITGKIYIYANFIPNDQKDKDEGTTGLPSLGVMVRKDKPPEILTLKSRVDKETLWWIRYLMYK